MQSKFNERKLLGKIIEILLVVIVMVLIAVIGYLTHRVDRLTDGLHKVDKSNALVQSQLRIIDIKVDKIGTGLENLRRDINSGTAFRP